MPTLSEQVSSAVAVLELSADKAKAIVETDAVVTTDLGDVDSLPRLIRIASEKLQKTIPGSLFDSVLSGIEGTEIGYFFSVPSVDTANFITLYKNENGNAVEIKHYPSADGVIDRSRFEAETALLEKRTGDYSGADIYPLLIDEQLNILLGFDTEAKKIIGAGIGDAEEAINSINIGRSVNSPSVYPLLVDAELNILLGFDTEAKKIIGAGIGETTALAQEIKSLNHLISYGQSLSIGSRGFPEISTNQPYSNLSFSGGPRADDGVLTSSSALIENSDTSPLGETICSAAANYACTLAAVENGIDPNSHVIFASAAGVGGQSITALNKGSSYYTSKLLAQIQSAHAINQDHAVQVVAWEQGEADLDARMTREEYLNHLTQLCTDIGDDTKAITGQKNAPYFITYQTSYGARAHKDICLAQLDAVKRSDQFCLSTPCYILPFYEDNVHLTNVGYKLLGSYIGRAYKQRIIDNRKPDYLEPVSAVLIGNIVKIKFKVPTLPLVLDTEGMASTTDMGFCVKDSNNNNLTISNISVVSSYVIIALSTTPASDVTARYALDYSGVGLTAAGVGSGNLRDSTSDIAAINGIDHQLFHAAPHFEVTAYKLGE